MLNAQTVQAIRKKKKLEKTRLFHCGGKKTAEQKALFSPFQPPFSPRGQCKSHLPGQRSTKCAMGLIGACMLAAPMQSTRQLTALLTHCRGASAWAIGAVKSHLASWDGFCHRFSTVLNLCKHSPTPYLALSSFYCFLFFLSPTYSTDESSTLTIPIPDKKKKKTTSSTCHLRIKAFFFQYLAASQHATARLAVPTVVEAIFLTAHLHDPL